MPGMRILVAEDDVRMAAMLRRGLGEDGYAVDVVSDGLEALWQATEVEYDAIVLDLMLPGANGFEVCRRLREANRWAPVLLLTARTDVRDPHPPAPPACRRSDRVRTAPADRRAAGRRSRSAGIQRIVLMSFSARGAARENICAVDMFSTCSGS